MKLKTSGGGMQFPKSQAVFCILIKSQEMLLATHFVLASDNSTRGKVRVIWGDQSGLRSYTWQLILVVIRSE